jgi:hypothetical protein
MVMNINEIQEEQKVIVYRNSIVMFEDEWKNASKEFVEYVECMPSDWYALADCEDADIVIILY